MRYFLVIPAAGSGRRLAANVPKQYAALGSFDFVNVIEAPNNDAMMRISMELGSRGTIRIETMAALNLGGFVDSLQKTA